MPLKLTTMKKEVVFTLPYETEDDIQAAKDLCSELYHEYINVGVYPNGLHEVKIVANN